MIIDTHIHIISNEITQKITKDPWSPITGYDDGKPFVEFQGKRLSSVINEFVDVGTILNKQTKAGVDISVLSPWSSLFRYDSDVRTCQRVNRIQNDAIFEIVKTFILNVGGADRIRTGVDGFADHCLATRPSDLNKIRLQT